MVKDKKVLVFLELTKFRYLQRISFMNQGSQNIETLANKSTGKRYIICITCLLWLLLIFLKLQGQ